VDAKKLAGPAIEAVETGAVEFIPKQWENTYFSWMRDIQDWCISRQLWWGHRIPAWYDSSGNVYVGNDEAAVRKSHGLPDTCVLTQDDDVLDTWFSSALWTFSTLGWPRETEELKRFHPASVLVTGFDIIFFWVARMIMMSLHLKKEVPFKQVYVHGLVRDAEGQKMSKSKGNVLDPIDLIDGIDIESLVQKRTSALMQPQQAQKIDKATRRQFPDGIPGYGTDALRYTFYSLASTGRDIKFDLGRMEGFRNFCNKLWNAARYVLMNTEGFDHTCEYRYSLADQWIRSKLQTAVVDTTKNLEQYRFDHAAQTLYDFVWNEYCDWYLELSKPVLWDDSAPSELRQGTLKTLLEVLETVLRLMHPLTPFITEEIWQNVTPRLGLQGDTIMLAQWPAPDSDAVNIDAEAEMEWLKTIIVAIRIIRNEANIPPGDSLDIVLGNTVDTDLERIQRHKPSLEKLAKVSSIRAVQSDEDQMPVLSALAGTIEVMVPMAGVVDFAKELERLEKELTRLGGEQTRLTGKLSNEKFTARAPEHVVEAERAKLAEVTTAISSVQAQKTNLELLR
ncbi:MAG: class I tRNA ligase family protein, partial [Luminiphilus sp.]|nr:class I tRNA ligase family protein [Luminiphilus sp.]